MAPYVVRICDRLGHGQAEDGWSSGGSRSVELRLRARRALSQDPFHVGDRAGDLFERPPVALRIGEALAGKESPRLVLMAAARFPTLEQPVVHIRIHPPDYRQIRGNV